MVRSPCNMVGLPCAVPIIWLPVQVIVGGFDGTYVRTYVRTYVWHQQYHGKLHQDEVASVHTTMLYPSKR